jgi:predicted Ser/Thr protein kinase
VPEELGSGFDRRTDDLFLAAMDLDPAERPAFLDGACGSNLELRAALESLLQIAEASPDLLTPPEIGMIPEQLGRYEIMSELGRGGMGIVFQARDSRLLRTVALKVLPRYLGQETRNLRRFTREAQWLARLNHPNIATLYSLDESDGFHFLTMEFVEGVTLSEILAERGLGRQEALSLALQVALALESAHSQGICHCDLKPANIMVSPDGKVSLLDFGIARAFGQLMAVPAQLATNPATFTLPAGTPGYMAPEQASGRPVDERSDLWAFGVVLFECLTGEVFRPPATAEAGDWTAKLPRKTPRDLVALMRACLEPDPDKRLASAAEARMVLERLLRRGAFHRRWLAWAATGLAVASAALWFVVVRGPEGPVVQLQNRDDQTLVATNAKGEALWTRQFDTERVRYPIVLREAGAVGESTGPRKVTGCAVIVDLAKYKSVLDLLSPTDGRTTWTGLPEWEVPVNAHGPFQFSWLLGADWPGQESEILALGIRDGPWYGFAVEFLDIEGRVLGTYHHPGILLPLAPSLMGEVAFGGPIFYGSNSSARFDRALVPFPTEQHVGCVVQLDPSDVTGQGYPYSENLPEERDWPGMPHAREKAYLLIPPINDTTSSRVGEIVAGDPNAGMEIFTAFLADGRVITLDENLFPVKARVVLGSVLETMMKEGRAPNLPFLYMRYGEKQWVDVPLGY